jgi:hypothetical protein
MGLGAVDLILFGSFIPIMKNILPQKTMACVGQQVAGPNTVVECTKFPS